MNRQEPVIDARFLKCRTLTNRVELAWDDLERLAAQSSLPAADASAAASAEPQGFSLTEAEKKALIARLAPAVEASLRENLKDAVEMAASNAVTRLKADLERSVAASIQQAVAREVRKLDLSEIVKR